MLLFQVLGGQRHLTAVLGDRLLPEAGGLSKTLLGKLDDHVPHSAQHLADFERVSWPGWGWVPPVSCRVIRCDVLGWVGSGWFAWGWVGSG